MFQCGSFREGKLALLEAKAEGVGPLVLSYIHDPALWTVLMEIPKSSQSTGLSVTHVMIWYKKISWANGTKCLVNDN